MPICSCDYPPHATARPTSKTRRSRLTSTWPWFGTARPITTRLSVPNRLGDAHPPTIDCRELSPLKLGPEANPVWPASPDPRRRGASSTLSVSEIRRGLASRLEAARDGQQHGAELSRLSLLS